MPASYPRVPYGVAHFKTIRLERALYVDKIRLLHPLETERYVVLIHSRRFGKSRWVSVLNHYYDRFAKDAKGGLYNTDRVLYSLKESISLGHVPHQLIDHNVRIDYGKLRHKTGEAGINCGAAWWTRPCAAASVGSARRPGGRVPGLGDGGLRGGG